MVGGCSSVSGATFPFERSVNCEKCVSERAVRWDKINHFEGKENTKYREMVTRKYDNCVFCESLFKLRFINMERCVHTWTLFVSKWKMFDISFINPNLCPTWMAIQHTEVILYINWYPSLLCGFSICSWLIILKSSLCASPHNAFFILVVTNYHRMLRTSNPSSDFH